MKAGVSADSRPTANQLLSLYTDGDLNDEQIEMLCALALCSLKHAEKFVSEDYKPLFTWREIFDKLKFGERDYNL